MGLLEDYFFVRCLICLFVQPSFAYWLLGHSTRITGDPEFICTRRRCSADTSLMIRSCHEFDSLWAIHQLHHTTKVRTERPLLKSNANQSTSCSTPPFSTPFLRMECKRSSRLSWSLRSPVLSVTKFDLKHLQLANRPPRPRSSDDFC